MSSILYDGRSALSRWQVPSHWIVMGVLFAGALGIGYALLPGQVQRVAMLESDGQTQQALELLERSYANGNRNVLSLMQLEALYEDNGNLAKARLVLADLMARQPRDANVLKRAATFYKMTQDERGYVATLKAQVALRYSEETCKELIGILRLAARIVEEQAAIQDCRHHGYRRPEDLVRLASLVTADGDLAQASTILRGIDDLRRLKTERERTQLIATLLDLGQPREAYRRALRWLRAQRDPPLAQTIINMFANAGQHDVGIELAKDVSVPGDSISLTIAELMLDRGQPLAAKPFLRGWLEKSQLRNEDTLSRFIVATLDAEDPDTALAAAKRYGLARVPQPDLVALAEALAATGRTAEFDNVRAVIQPEVLAENPLLEAAVALQRGAPDAGKSLLSSVAVDELDEWRLSLWARLMDRTGKTDVAAETLRQMGAETAGPEPTVQPERVTIEPRMIRRPKRVTRPRSKRPAITRYRAPGQAPAPVSPFGTNVLQGGG